MDTILTIAYVLCFIVVFWIFFKTVISKKSKANDRTIHRSHSCIYLHGLCALKARKILISYLRKL
jgi:hypothetical protein